MSEYRGGYRNQPARFIQAGFQRKKYEATLTADLAERQAGVNRGEPNAVNPRYAGRETNLGGENYIFFYPETMDLGRVKVTHIDTNDWTFEWEDRRY
jgi:hypothetical protein